MSSDTSFDGFMSSRVTERVAQTRFSTAGSGHQGGGARHRQRRQGHDEVVAGRRSGADISVPRRGSGSVHPGLLSALLLRRLLVEGGGEEQAEEVLDPESGAVAVRTNRSSQLPSRRSRSRWASSVGCAPSQCSRRTVHDS